MKKTALLLVVLLALALPSFAGAADSKQTKTVPRFVCGVLNGAFTFDIYGGGDWDFFTLGDMGGTLTHLGLSKMYTVHQPTASGELLNGTFTIVAANGDEIQGTYTGFVTWVSDDAPQYYGEADLVIIGGTGRFAKATGTLNATFFETLDLETWVFPVTWTLSGNVSY